MQSIIAAITDTSDAGDLSPANDSHEAPRFDLYRLVHKGLRAYMFDLLTAIGRMDCEDPASVTETIDGLRGLFDVLGAHLDKETQFIHPAMEARQSGSAARTLGEHAEHEYVSAGLAELMCAVEHSTGAERREAADNLYHDLALFVADSLRHMHVEETWNNAVLWKHYSDAELLALQQRLVASLPPPRVRDMMRWMLPAATPAERASVLAGMKRTAPPEVVADTLAMLQAHLTERNLATLLAAIRSW